MIPGLASMVAEAKVGVSKNSSEHIVTNTPFRNYSAKEAVNSVNETSIKVINETDRKKIQSWTYPPSNEKYLKYKEVFDNPKYYNQETGNINWPPNNGFDVEPVVVTLDNGVLIDRYGNPGGTFVSPEGIPYEQRALALHSDEAPYHKYEILIPFDVEAGKIAPWFDRPGGGTQYFTGNMEVLDIDTGEMVVANVENLERLGYIREIK
ncbi:TNT domain-containing protein [Guptibacillus hwajinpoensis]|uniref:TNT domain-containing protein n=1 Tax=Guptibacillus hwajinpoensis TaxID=208199 RepID=UPI003CFF17BA